MRWCTVACVKTMMATVFNGSMWMSSSMAWGIQQFAFTPAFKVTPVTLVCLQSKCKTSHTVSSRALLHTLIFYDVAHHLNETTCTNLCKYLSSFRWFRCLCCSPLCAGVICQCGTLMSLCPGQSFWRGWQVLMGFSVYSQTKLILRSWMRLVRQTSE